MRGVFVRSGLFLVCPDWIASTSIQDFFLRFAYLLLQQWCNQRWLSMKSSPTAAKSMTISVLLRRLWNRNCHFRQFNPRRRMGRSSKKHQLPLQWQHWCRMVLPQCLKSGKKNSGANMVKKGNPRACLGSQEEWEISEPCMQLSVMFICWLFFFAV